MCTLNVGLRVSDLERSLAFYIAVGYIIVGTVVVQVESLDTAIADFDADRLDQPPGRLPD